MAPTIKIAPPAGSGGRCGLLCLGGIRDNNLSDPPAPAISARRCKPGHLPSLDRVRQRESFGSVRPLFAGSGQLRPKGPPECKPGNPSWWLALRTGAPRLVDDPKPPESSRQAKPGPSAVLQPREARGGGAVPGMAAIFCRECITEHEDRVVCTACLRKLGSAVPRAPRLPACSASASACSGSCWPGFSFISRARDCFPCQPPSMKGRCGRSPGGRGNELHG